MTSPTKVLLLEMDAGDRELISRWAADGTMPVFGRLLNSGLSGDTMSLRDFFVGGIWPSLCTGVTPDRHGIHSQVQLRNGTYDFFDSDINSEIKRRPFWETLSKAGRRVAILDIPLSGLSDRLNGIQSVEWGCHDRVYGFRARPPEFEQDVKDRFGSHPLDVICNDHGDTVEDFIDLRDKLVAGVRKKRDLTKHYLGQGGWDFFAQVFTESHCAGHQCWHLHDADYPGHDPDMVAATGDPMRDVYREIDAAIGDVLQLVDDTTTVVVLAGHRMAHKCGAQFLLPDILDALGVAILNSPQKKDAVDRVDEVLTWGWQHTPQLIKKPLQGLRQALRGWIDERDPAPSFPPSVSRLDVANSHCFTMDIGFPVSGIRLNLVGREPHGLIETGAEAERFCEQLSEDLLAIVDLETGTKMVTEVRKTDDDYHGEYRNTLPDLLVEWNVEHRLGSTGCGDPAGSYLRLHSDKMGVVEGTNHYVRTGDHRPEGMFVAFGPGVPQGRLDRTVSIMDFAPTFCQLLDTELPDVDGVPIEELLRVER